MGILNKTGRISADIESPNIRKGEYDELEFVVIPARLSGDGKDVVVTQSDILNIIRAKGAVYAAATVVLKALDMKFDDLAEIMVAGAFGNFLNLENAIFIGLLPDIPSDRLRFVGNSSLAGTKLSALCDDCYEEAYQIADRTTYFELSTDLGFMDQFVSASFLPHTDIELFPSVLAELESR